jgi:hypothetical protein
MNSNIYHSKCSTHSRRRLWQNFRVLMLPFLSKYRIGFCNATSTVSGKPDYLSTFLYFSSKYPTGLCNAASTESGKPDC